MGARPSCDDVQALTAELALGLASGEERARALEHAASCPRCRRELAGLSEVADELLLLAPPHEPPPGFESEVLERLGATASPRRRRETPRIRAGWRRALVPAATALAAAGIAVGVMLEVTEDDRETASDYRRALQQANGSYFGALPLRDPSGRRAGLVFGYEGRPSWVFVLLESARAGGRWTVELGTRSHGVITLGSVAVTDGRGSFGRALPVPLREVARVSVVERGGERRLVAVARPEQ